MRYTPNLCHKVEVGKHVAPHDMGGGVNSLEGQETLQRDLERLEHWAVINLCLTSSNSEQCT